MTDTTAIERLFDHQPWTRKAACHGLTTLFFSAALSDVKRAKAVCATCPVIDQCRNAADAEMVRDGGVWAGMSANHRRNQRAVDRAASVINHGTNAGYQMHLRNGIPVCEPCRQARIDDRAARQAQAAAFRDAGGHNAEWENVA